MKLNVFNTDTGQPEVFEIPTDKGAYVSASAIMFLVGLLIGFAIHIFH